MLAEHCRLDGSERWYAVHTAPHRESFAAVNLERQGFRTFVPRLKRTVRHARRVQDKLTAFFPRYMFVILDLTRDPWRSVNGTFGVTSLVMEAGLPKAVPRGVVEGLADIVDDRGSLDLRDRLEVGQTLRVVSGPLAEHVGILVKVSESRRVEILLELLGAERRVALDGDMLIPSS